ncbi:MAG: patatin-like phospholipase family protein [Clostridia bacterium]|nr:patatin-like phospholipase family protein [Clostridia bacterium]
MRIGLALGSGGLRGAAHIGVLSELDRAGINIDMIAGTSAGSVIAVMYARGMTAEQIEERALTLAARDIIDPTGSTLMYLIAPTFLFFLGWRRLLPKGILRGTKLEAFIRRELGEIKMSDLKIPCAVVSVDIHTGDKIVFTSEASRVKAGKQTCYFDEHVADAVRASCSIPGVFVWKEWRGRCLVDGAIREPVPARVLKEMGCDYVIAVDLGYTGQADEKVDGLPSVVAQALDVLGEEVSDYVLANYADIVIKPRLYNVALTDTSRIPECIDAGRRSAQEMIPAIRRALRRRVISRIALL